MQHVGVKQHDIALPDVVATAINIVDLLFWH